MNRVNKCTSGWLSARMAMAVCRGSEIPVRNSPVGGRYRTYVFFERMISSAEPNTFPQSSRAVTFSRTRAVRHTELPVTQILFPEFFHRADFVWTHQSGQVKRAIRLVMARLASSGNGHGFTGRNRFEDWATRYVLIKRAGRRNRVCFFFPFSAPVGCFPGLRSFPYSPKLCGFLLPIPVACLFSPIRGPGVISQSFPASSYIRAFLAGVFPRRKKPRGLNKGGVFFAKKAAPRGGAYYIGPGLCCRAKKKRVFPGHPFNFLPPPGGSLCLCSSPIIPVL